MNCMRCGRCCLEVGRTFWKVGNLSAEKPFNPEKAFGDIEELNKRANDGDHEDGGLPCEMLTFENGRAVCIIQRDYGYDAKPTVCKNYPENGEKCFAELALFEVTK